MGEQDSGKDVTVTVTVSLPNNVVSPGLSGPTIKSCKPTFAFTSKNTGFLIEATGDVVETCCSNVS